MSHCAQAGRVEALVTPACKGQDTPLSWVAALTPDQPNFVYTATFLCLGNAKFFFSFKIVFFDYMVPLALAADSRI
jgi:hypothetical protein